MSASLFFFFAAILAMLGVLFSLLRGIFFMTKEGDKERVKSNKSMQMRLILQGVAILFLFISYALK